MLERWKKTITGLPPGARATIAFALVPPAVRAEARDLYGALVAVGAMQADVVLVLLRTGFEEDRRAAEKLVGRPIRRGLPYVPPHPPLPVRKRPRRGDQRRFTMVTKPNPRAAGTPARERYEEIRVGRTVAEFLKRGGTRRDVRDALRAGWIRIEGEQADEG